MRYKQQKLGDESVSSYQKSHADQRDEEQAIGGLGDSSWVSLYTLQATSNTIHLLDMFNYATYKGKNESKLKRADAK
jgi:hypothetical protein